MKNYLVSGLFLLCSVVAFAAPGYRLTPADSNTQTCVGITSYTWTACPTTASGTRQDLWIVNGTTDPIAGTTDNTVAISTAQVPIIIPARSMLNYPLTSDVVTYFRSLGNGPGTVCTDERTYK